METKEFKMIQVSKEVHSILESRKVIKRESFNDVIERLIIDNERFRE